MITIVAVIHLIVCFLLIALVLLQDPKSSGGGVFGGSGANSLLGATGAVTFLTKLTRYSAIIFGVTCLLLTLLSRTDTSSVIDSGMPISAPATAPGASKAAPGSDNANAEKTSAPEAPQQNQAPKEK